MKYIELLNKMYNDEEVPKTIYLYGEEPFYYNDDRNVYCDKHDIELGHYVAIDMMLNDEVETEPNKHCPTCGQTLPKENRI